MADLSVLSDIGYIKAFNKNQTVFIEKDTGASMYIVLKGIFGVYINSFSDFPVRVASIEKGSFFGEMSVIDGWARSATIISEDESEVIAIEKEVFGEMLEKAPFIASDILNTLRERAIKTAEAVKNSGKEVPDLPPHLKTVQFDDVKKGMVFLTMLAKQVRKMDEMLIPPSLKQEVFIAPKKIEQILNFLPDGYIKYNLNENKDNSPFLEKKDVTCPHCGNVSGAYIPLLSALEQNRTTLDGRVIYKNFDILKYTNIICPNCYYTDVYQEFITQKDRKTDYDNMKFINAEDFTGYANELNHTIDEAVVSYYLNIECLKQVTNNPLRFANAWIRLYWLYGDQRSTTLVKQAAEKARYYYADFLSENESDLSTEDKMRLNIILGELLITLDDYKQAREYYQKNVDMGKMYNNDLYKDSLTRYKELSK